jgi:hypothetical protein
VTQLLARSVFPVIKYTECDEGWYVNFNILTRAYLDSQIQRVNSLRSAIAAQPNNLLPILSSPVASFQVRMI